MADLSLDSLTTQLGNLSLTTQSFRFLGQLPLELQYMIIHLTYEPQTIVIGNDFKIGQFPRNTTPVPVALRINHTYRQEALRYFERLQLISWEDSGGKEAMFLRDWPLIYMNFETDNILMCKNPEIAKIAPDEQAAETLYEPSLRFVSHIHPDQRERLRFLFTDLPLDAMPEAECDVHDLLHRLMTAKSPTGLVDTWVPTSDEARSGQNLTAVIEFRNTKMEKFSGLEYTMTRFGGPEAGFVLNVEFLHECPKNVDDKIGRGNILMRMLQNWKDFIILPGQTTKARR